MKSPSNIPSVGAIKAAQRAIKLLDMFGTGNPSTKDALAHIIDNEAGINKMRQALVAMLHSYAPDADATAINNGEDSLPYCVQLARAALKYHA